MSRVTKHLYKTTCAFGADGDPLYTEIDVAIRYFVKHDQTPEIVRFEVWTINGKRDPMPRELQDAILDQVEEYCAVDMLAEALRSMG